MSGTTTGGGIPPHDIVIADPNSGRCFRAARSDLEKWHQSLAEGEPLKVLLEKLLAE